MITDPMDSTSRSDIIPVFGMAFSLSQVNHYRLEEVRYIVVLAERISFSMRMRRWKARNELLMMMTVLSLRHQRNLVLTVKTSLMAMRSPSGMRKRKRCSPLSGDPNGLSTRMRKMIICAPMVVTSARGTCLVVRHPKIMKWKMLRTMTSLSCSELHVGRSVIAPRLAQRSVVMKRRRHWIIKMTRLTVIASVVQFNQRNRISLPGAASVIVILNPPEARTLWEVLIGTRSEPRRKRSEGRKLLWMR